MPRQNTPYVNQDAPDALVSRPTSAVLSVGADAPVTSTGGSTPIIGMPQATVTVDGYLSAADWATFNAKGTGTVSSVGLSLPAMFTVSGSPVTNSGTLTAVLATESANLVFAGPTTGAAAAPTFRTLVTADIPAGFVTNVTGTAPLTSSGGATPAIGCPVFVASGGSHATGLVPDPGASSGTTKFLREDATWQVPAGGGGGSATTWSLADIVTSQTINGAPGGVGSGNFTEGSWFYCTSAKVVTGIKAYWPGSPAKTLTLSLYSAAGTLLASGTVAVLAAGVYTVTFGSPVTLTPYALYNAARWENSGTYFWGIATSGSTGAPALGGLCAQNDLYVRDFYADNSGNACPTSVVSGFTCGVSPILA